MKAFFALLPIFITISAFGMEDKNIEHIEPQHYQFNTIELCSQPCQCFSQIGFIDNFGHSFSLTKSTIPPTYTFDMEGFNKLSLSSLQSIFNRGMCYHAGKKDLWHFHKQFLFPLVMAIKQKKEEKRTFVSDAMLQQFSILLRDLLIAQEDNPELLVMLFKAGANPDCLVNTPEVTGDLSTKPVFFFAKTVSLLTSCVKNHATLTRTDSNNNTILHEIVCDAFLPIEEKKELLSFCLNRGVQDDLNSSQKTACDICGQKADQYQGDIRTKWFALCDMILRTDPDKQKENTEKPENNDKQKYFTLTTSKPIPIPAPQQKQQRSTSWWFWK
jgi:hypothetical protein